MKSREGIFRITVLVLCCFLILGTRVFSFDPVKLPAPGNLLQSDEQPWTLTADRIEYLRDEDVYRAEGRVILQSGDRRIEADRAFLYKKDGLVKLSGNVTIGYGEDWIKSDTVTWNLEKQSGYVEKGRLYFAKNHFYVEAERIEKLEGDEYILEHGFVTTCNPSSPDWSVRYRRLLIPPDGMAEARHVVFQIGSVPVIFVPWFIVPVNAERQSGILRPVTGFSSLNGFVFEIPYYWAISQSQDATFFGEILQKRGFMSGIEYRWNDARWGEGIFIAHYLRDIADEESVRARGFSLGDRDRFWIRGRALMGTSEIVEARINLDMVSDRDFLSEFTQGSPSFEYTDTAFKSFLRTGLLIDKTRTARESNVYFFRRSEDGDVSVDFHYWDENDPLLKDTTFQELPYIGFSIGSSPVPKFPFYYGVRSSMTQYWKNDGGRSTKIYIAPEVTFPWKLASAINTKTNLSLQSVLYNYDAQFGKESDGLEGRSVPVFNSEANLRLEREYSLNFWGMSSVIHNIGPELGYEYAPKVEEKRIPSFDELSNVFYTNRLRYGVRSFLTADTEHSSIELARLKLFQYYLIGEQKIPFSENGFTSPVTGGNGFSDVYLDVEFTPHKYVDISYSIAASPDDLSFKQHDAILAVNTLTGQRLGIEYRYRENSGVDEIIGSFNWDIRPWLSLGTYHNYSFARHELFKQGYSVTYRRSCWTFTASYELEGEDRRFFVSVNFLGLGQVMVK